MDPFRNPRGTGAAASSKPRTNGDVMTSKGSGSSVGSPLGGGGHRSSASSTRKAPGNHLLQTLNKLEQESEDRAYELIRLRVGAAHGAGRAGRAHVPSPLQPCQGVVGRSGRVQSRRRMWHLHGVHPRVWVAWRMQGWPVHRHRLAAPSRGALTSLGLTHTHTHTHTRVHADPGAQD